jgi:hypothetical protein
VQVLVLHLLRMGHTAAGGVKDSSDVHFDEEITVPPGTLSDGLRHMSSRYRLLATIVHRGAAAIDLPSLLDRPSDVPICTCVLEPAGCSDIGFVSAVHRPLHQRNVLAQAGT